MAKHPIVGIALVLVNRQSERQRKRTRRRGEIDEVFVSGIEMTMPGEHRYADEISRRPVVEHPIDDAMTAALENMDHRLHRVTMAQGLPAHAFFLAGGYAVDPE